MMNFREELSKIYKNQMQNNPRFEKEIDFILKQIRNHLEKKKFSNLLAGIRIKFRISEGAICVQECSQELNKEKTKETICVEYFGGSSEDARIVLLLLERKFKDEGYYMWPGNNPALNSEFSVVIKA